MIIMSIINVGLEVENLPEERYWLFTTALPLKSYFWYEVYFMISLL